MQIKRIALGGKYESCSLCRNKISEVGYENKINTILKAFLMDLDREL